MAVFNRNIEKANFYMPVGRRRNGEVIWGALRYHWGTTGIGKSNIVEDLAYHLGADAFHSLTAGNTGPQDGSIPVPDAGGEFYRQLAPEWVHELNEAASAVLFLDEFGDGSRATQTFFQTMTSERRVGSEKLGGHIRIMAAGNPSDISTMGEDPSVPNANRGGHVEINFDEAAAYDFIDWGLSGGSFQHDDERIDRVSEEARVLALWPKAYGQMWSVAAGYMKKSMNEDGPTRVLSIPAEGNPQRTRAFPTPRMDDRAISAAAASEIHGLSDADTESFIASFVGEAWASEFLTYKEEADLLDPDDVLSGKAKFVFEPGRPDRAIVTLDSCASRLAYLQREGAVDKKQSVEMARRVWSTIAVVSKVDIDLTASAARTLVRARLVRGIKEAASVLEEMWPMLEAAGFKGGK